MLSDHLLLNLPYDMTNVQAKSEGVSRVLKSYQKAPKASAVITTAPAQTSTMQGIKTHAPFQGPAPK
ncbi:hypothetical protein PanWU01x14_136660 [Parasponia andersonii]|uniref:Uncharacterized protein n=1 Tax=Parasponia andersonii TaxID=3476 RepID=A0A2P5CP04_PARAD|nr:hypothetical protein PanWU01x14_136660 [Parasponia andersonii]